MNKTAIEALKPCPFCGGRATVQHGVHTKYVMCAGCEVMGPHLNSTAELHAEWNRRTTLPDGDAGELVERPHIEWWKATDDDLVEPSDTERSEWPLATEDYVYGLECIKLSQAARIRYLEAENRALLAAENREGKWALHPASQVAVAAYEAGQADAEKYCEPIIEQLEADVDRHINTAAELRLALDSLLEYYVNMINSGDCGNWNPETEPEVIAARAAVTQPRAADTPEGDEA